MLGFTFPSFPFAPLVVVGPFQRQQSRLFQGGPLHVPLQVPLSASGRGLDVLFHWVTAESANPGLMDGAPPVLVRL